MNHPSSSSSAANSPDYKGDITPHAAWEMLVKIPNAVLVDVRTPEEWDAVGVPDISSLSKEMVLLPWYYNPDRTPNENFASTLATSFPDHDTPLLFMCKSGGRSARAAKAMTQKGYTQCYNITGGYEGDIRNGSQNDGWKISGLPCQTN